MEIFETSKMADEKVKEISLGLPYYERSFYYKEYDEENGTWGSWQEEYSNTGEGVRMSKTSTREERTVLTLKKQLFGNFAIEEIEKVYLTLPIGSEEQNYNGTIVIGGLSNEAKEISYNASNGDLVLDITEVMVKGGSITNLSFTTKEDGELIFNKPIIEVVNYSDPEIAPMVKELSLAGVGVEEVDLITGKTIAKINAVKTENSVFGVPIYQVIKSGVGDLNMGKNVTLNLNEKLKKRQGGNVAEYNFVYEGENGRKQGLKKYYYNFDENNNKIYRKISDFAIEIDKDGRLYADGVEVFLEIKYGDYKVIPQTSSGYNKISLYEKRSEEQKQLEEQLKNYKDALEDYVVVDRTTVEKKNELKNKLSYIEYDYFKLNAQETNNVLLTNGQAETLKTLYIQKENLEDNKTSLASQRYTYIIQSSQNGEMWGCIGNQINAINQSIAAASAQLDHIDTLLESDENNDKTSLNLERASCAAQLNSLEAQLGQLNKQKEHLGQVNTNLETLKSNITTQIGTLQEQLEFTDSQIDAILEKHEENLENVEKYYKEYYNLNQKFEEVERQSPVNFLTDGKLTKGFNANGDLVVLYDAVGNYAVVERERYALTTQTGYRIKRIYDEKENSIDFEYDGGGKLTSITDIMGEKTSYTYSNGNLTGITYANGKRVNLSFYNDELTMIYAPSSKITARITKTTNENGVSVVVKNISDYDQLSKEDFAISNQDVSNITVFCAKENGNYATITDDAEVEKYVYNEDGVMTEYYVEQGGRVVKAERYEHVPYWKNGVAQTYPHKLTVKAKKSSLTCSLENYTFVDGDSERITLNQFEQPISKVYSPERWSYDNTATKTVSVFYTYDDNERLIKEEEQTVYSSPAKTINKIKEYYYTKFGAISKTETYVRQDMEVLGKEVEEFFYDDKGNQIKTCKYNTFDTSSKFYTEREINEKGQTLLEYDNLGENKTQYLYNGNKVVGEKLPNESVFAIEKDDEGNVLAISNTADDSEENSTSKVYKYGNLVEVRSGNNVINYEYDGKGRKTKVLLNGVAIKTIVYADNVEIDGVVRDKITITDGQNNVTEEIYDKEGKLLKTTKGENSVTYTYNANGDIIAENDSLSYSKNYYYDYENRYTNYYYGNNGGQSYSRDSYGRINKKTVAFNNAMTGGAVYNYTYAEDARNIVSQMTVNSLTEKYNTDGLGRLFSVKQDLGMNHFTKRYKFLKRGDHATNLINTEYFRNGSLSSEKTTYTYDNMGNVISINVNGKQTTKFEYDKLCRLIKETHIDIDKEMCYIYDDNGNILSKTENGVETVYKYNQGTDELVYFGNSFVGYSSGYPTTYNGKQFVWNRGVLTAINNNPNNPFATFTYNGFNERLTKTVNGVVSNYIYHKGELLKETRGEDTIIYIYGKEGIAGIKVNDAEYIFRKNIFGDVTHIYSISGGLVGEYKYTAFGECTVITDINGIATLNPIRYRGYYYDAELNLYYLVNRYYDPKSCRFISRDDVSYADPESINGLNLYAYCGNNPVMNTDPSGTAFIASLLIGAAIGAIAGGVSYAAGQVITGLTTGKWDWSWGGFLGSIVGGAIGGAIGGSMVGLIGNAIGLGSGAIGLVRAAVSGFTTTFGSMLGENITGDAEYSFGEMLGVSLFATVGSVLSVGIMNSSSIPANSFNYLFKKEFFQKLFENIYEGMPGVVLSYAYEHSKRILKY